MTLQELAQQALDVQNACNVSAVAHGMARAATALRDLGFYRTNHPILQLWADKIASLTDTQTLGDDRVMAAYRTAGDLAEGGLMPEEHSAR